MSLILLWNLPPIGDPQGETVQPRTVSRLGYAGVSASVKPQKSAHQPAPQVLERPKSRIPDGVIRALLAYHLMEWME